MHCPQKHHLEWWGHGARTLQEAMPREINHLAVLGPEVLAGLGVASYESVELAPWLAEGGGTACLWLW